MDNFLLKYKRLWNKWTLNWTQHAVTCPCGSSTSTRDSSPSSATKSTRAAGRWTWRIRAAGKSQFGWCSCARAGATAKRWDRWDGRGWGNTSSGGRWERAPSRRSSSPRTWRPGRAWPSRSSIKTRSCGIRWSARWTTTIKNCKFCFSYLFIHLASLFLSTSQARGKQACILLP